MAIEIRVYYECLEQAVHYVKPLLEKSNTKIPIRLISRAKNASETNGGQVSAIYQLTTPDFLITYCNDTVEIPLIVGEFSESVLTEDHELQRAIGGLAAAVTNALYLKISGEKSSEREHGGNKNFNPLSVSKAYLEQFGYRGYIVAKWKTNKKNPLTLHRNSQYTSCPAEAACPLAEFVLEKLAEFVSLTDTEIKENFSSSFCNKYSNQPLLSGYFKTVEVAPTINETFNDWASRRPIRGWRRVEVDQNKIIVKINRFSHAADPDRGVLTYLSSICNKNEVYTRYCVKSYQNNDITGLVPAFIEQAKTEGMSFDGFLSNFKLDHTNSITITDQILKRKDGIFSNKVLLSILFFSDGMVVHSKTNSAKILLRWDRKQLFGVTQKDIFPSLKRLLRANTTTPPIPICESGQDLTEDEVTYIVVHEILKPNKFSIVSVSYPGAQGEAAILPERDLGRQQSRMYIDVIAWLPGEYSGDIALEEVKETLNQKIDDDVAKLLAFKKEEALKNALIETLHRLDQPAPKNIVIGVAFGAKSAVLTTWNPKEVDFIIRILDGSRWQVAPFGTKLKSCFTISEGTVSLPPRCRIIPK